MDGLPPIYGEDPVFLEAVEEVSRLAAIERPCLVVGERGTGKELLTSRIHYLSSRWDGPLVKINCAALSDSLLESELFGHEAGAFTGEQRRHIGRFERAQGGTLILDEIATATLSVQEKVLRVIEYGEFERVGGRETLAIDVRVVGATNVDLPTLVDEGRFRPDLLDRLAFEVLTVPPLRARPADIVALSQEFGLDMTRKLERSLFVGFSAAAMRTMLAHDWPGNVRELKNVVERSVFRWASLDEPIGEIIIDPFASPWRPAAGLTEKVAARAASATPHPPVAGLAASEKSLRGQVSEFEKRLLLAGLQRENFNQTRAAQALGLSYHQFRRLLAKHELP